METFHIKACKSLMCRANEGSGGDELSQTESVTG